MKIEEISKSFAFRSVKLLFFVSHEKNLCLVLQNSAYMRLLSSVEWGLFLYVVLFFSVNFSFQLLFLIVERSISTNTLLFKYHAKTISQNISCITFIFRKRLPLLCLTSSLLCVYVLAKQAFADHHNIILLYS